MAEIERLTLVWDANFAKMNDKLDKVIRSNYGAARKVEDAWNKNTVGKGLRRNFDDIAGGALAGVAPLNRFAGAMGTATVAGAALTAGLAAMAFSVTQAFEAMDFGDELQANADKLQITAEALQELQFAADETDVPIEKLQDNLAKLNSALGALKLGGKGSAKVVQAFANLGLSKEDLAGVKDASELLPILADRLGQVKDVAEQARIADRLGVRDLLPMLRQGSKGLEEMRDRARELGLVLSNETVQGLADAQRQSELAGQQIKASLRAAFAGLATDIAAATTALADFLVRLNKLGEKAPTAYAAIKALIMGGPLMAPLMVPRAIAQSKLPKGVKPTGPTAATADGFEVTPTPGTSKGSGSAEADANARRQRERQLAQELVRLEDQILATSRNEGASIDERLDVEYARLELAKQARDEEISQLQADFKRTKGKEGLSDAEAEQLRALEDTLYLQKREAARLDALRAVRAKQAELEAAITNATLEQLQIADGMATTQAERRRIQLSILKLERDQERDALDRKLKADSNVSEAERQRQLGAFDATTEARRGQVIAGTAGPMERARREIPRTAEEINEALESIQARGMKSLEDGWVDFITNSRKAGDIVHDIVNQMIADLARLAVQQAMGAFGDAGGLGGVIRTGLQLIGFGGPRAAGGPVSPGKAYLVGEHGPEPFIPNVPGTIIPNNVLKGLSARKPGRMMQVVNQYFSMNAPGAIGFKEFRAGLSAEIRRTSAVHAAQAAETAVAAVPGRINTFRDYEG